MIVTAATTLVKVFFHHVATNTTTSRTTKACSEGGGSHRSPQRAVTTGDVALPLSSGGPPVIGRRLKPWACVLVDELPNYVAVEVEKYDNAILPRDLLPTIVDNLPDKYYYRT